MGLQVIEHELTAKAPPATVFALLLDGSTWPSWSPIDSFELVEKGDGDPEGVGAVRIFRTGPEPEPGAAEDGEAQREVRLRTDRRTGRA